MSLNVDRYGDISKWKSCHSYNSSRLDAQLKVLAIREMDDADTNLKMVGLGDTFEKLMDIIILDWLFQIHESELKCALVNTLWKKGLVDSPTWDKRI